VILEDVIVWIFFAVLLPAFFYYFDLFGIQAGVTSLTVAIYLIVIYGVLMYKVFDWYADVWIGTTTTLIDVKWRWFTSNLLYIPYEKVEGIEVRTSSWITALVGMSDVVIKLAWHEEFSLRSARNPWELVEYLQNATKHKKAGHGADDKEPFDILVDTLSDVVKWHLTTRGKEYITRDYVEKLDDTLIQGRPIDLRTREEKIIISDWKERYTKKKDEHDDTEKDEHH
jgi:Bacterial PH domain